MESYQQLVNSESEIGLKYQSIFQLRNLGQQELLMKAIPFVKNSKLLLHQVYYALGQLHQQKYPNIRNCLISAIEDQKEFVVVRHQAAQGLANYMHIQDLQIFQKYSKAEQVQLRDTCLLGIQKLKSPNLKAKYGLKYSGTKQPAAPLSKQQFEQIFNEVNTQKLVEYFTNININIFNKYRLMYYLRNLNNQYNKIFGMLLREQYRLLTTPLFRHQVCFVIGQVNPNKDIEEGLIECISNEQENQIVRHQALNAYGSFSKNRELLKKYIQDQKSIIRQTAIVVLYQIKDIQL